MKNLKRKLRNASINLIGKYRGIVENNQNSRIIVFHEIPEKGLFKNRLIWLKENYNILSFEEINNHSLTKYKKQSISISFDDGFSCWHEIAAPILEELKIPATFFICSGILNKNKSIRTNFIKQNLNRSQKSLTAISKEQVKDISRKKLFNIGGHTINHIDLGNPKYIKIMKNEIYNDHQELSEIIGKKVKYFAYPRGRFQNLSKKSFELIKNSPYEYAFTTIPAFFSRETNPYLIPRDSMEFSDSLITWGNWLNGGYFSRKVYAHRLR